MNLRKIAATGLVAGLGALFLGASPASAGGGPVAGPQQAQSSAEGDGVLSGNSAAVPVAIPIEVCSNANGIGVLGLGIGGSFCDISAFSG